MTSQPPAQDQPDQPSRPSSDTATNEPSTFVDTLEYRRFAEFCDPCRQYQYIQETPCNRWQDLPNPKPTYFEMINLYKDREDAIGNPTTLVVIDEADRLRLNKSGTLASRFDLRRRWPHPGRHAGHGEAHGSLPQFYSRIRFVREFRPLSAAISESFSSGAGHLPGSPSERRAHSRCRRSDSAHHRGQFPAAGSATDSDRAHPHHQRFRQHHTGHSANRAGEFRHRARLRLGGALHKRAFVRTLDDATKALFPLRKGMQLRDRLYPLETEEEPANAL